ncbi:lipoprotein BA_5634 family protein [Sporosarcina sp. CAU 1771]
MRKLLSVCLVALIAGSILTGCTGVTKMFTKANGIVLYGDHQQIEQSFKQEEKDLKSKDAYKIKIVEDGDQKIMVLDKKTAQALVDKELLKEVTTDNKTEPITSIPKGVSILFAKEELDEVNLNGQPMIVTYEGNIIIGDGRSYVDMFMVVDEAQWSSMKATEKTMGIIEYKKDPSEKMSEFDVEGNQLVEIKGN